MNKFTKNKLIDDLLFMASKIEGKWNFDRNNGYSQVEGANAEKASDYGRFRNLLDIAEGIRGGRLGV